MPEPAESAGDRSAFARIRPWVQAARPIAHPMIFVPLFLGQALSFHSHGRFSWEYFLYAHLFGLLYQVHLLYLNDHADEAVDRTNEQYWLSGGSRVLPQGKLRATDLLLGARVALLAMVALALYLAIALERPWMAVWIALAVALCWAYNRAPLRLSYRGGGEVLQGLGCGVLLPVIGFYMQSGSLQAFPLSAAVPLYLLFHAGNIVTALPDYRSDRAGDKRTVPVRHGQLRARTISLALLALAYAAFVAAGPRLAPLAVASIVVPSCLLLVYTVASRILGEADVSEFRTCKTFVALTSAGQAWFLCAWAAALMLEGTS